MPGKGLTEATVAGTEQKVYLHARVELSRKDIAHAMVRLDDAQGRPSIHLSFNEEGAARMEKLSKANQGKMLAIVVGGKVLSAPTIKTTLNSSALITGSLTLKEAEKIVAAINQKKEP